MSPLDGTRSERAGPPTSYRLGLHCLTQILRLSGELKLTQAEVIRLAVDRMAQAELIATDKQPREDGR